MNKIYTTKEAAAILSIKIRAVQQRCANERILRRSNKYVITDEIIQRWKQTYYQDLNATKKIVNATESKLHLIRNKVQNDSRNDEMVQKQIMKLTQMLVESKNELKAIPMLQNQIEKLYQSNVSLHKALTSTNEVQQVILKKINLDTETEE